MTHCKDNDNSELSEEETLIYGAYVRVAVSLQHSNKIQLTYKNLTYTWLLATFIGIGYMLSSREVDLPVNPLIIVVILSLASLAVIFLVWYLDLNVQEKKIASAVHAGIKLEEINPWLPQVYHNVLKMHYLFGYVSMKSVFYLGCVLILILNICCSLSAYFYLKSETWLPIPIIFLVVIPLFVILCMYITKKTDPYFILEEIHKKGEAFGNRRKR